MKSNILKKLVAMTLSILFIFGFTITSYASSGDVDFESLPMNTFLVGERDAYAINSPNFILKYIVTNTFSKTSSRNFYMKSPFKNPDTGEGMWFNILDGSVKGIADLKDPSKAISNQYLKGLVLNVYNDNLGQELNIITTSEPTATVTITPDSLLNEGFKLANVKVDVSSIEGADKYSITYSVYDNNNNEKTVTTKLAKVGQANEDLIQDLGTESNITVNVFDVNNNQINTEFETKRK